MGNWIGSLERFDWFMPCRMHNARCTNSMVNPHFNDQITQLLDYQIHSYLSDVAGSTVEARHAGTAHAASAATTRIAAVVVNVSGSIGSTP